MENDFMVARGEGFWEEIHYESGIDKKKTAIFKMDSQQSLLYSTGNSAQCPVITQMGKEF